jgi:hypothetical protein
MCFRPKETLEEIASDWLQESSNPFPVFIFNDESFQLLETPDPRGGILRILVPLESSAGTCHYLYRPRIDAEPKTPSITSTAK